VGDSGSWIVFVHSVVSQDSVVRVQLRRDNRWDLSTANCFRLGKLKSVSGVGRSCFVCLRINPGF
jgi:hypothetical protein